MPGQPIALHELQSQIEALDDAAAVRVLTAATRPILRAAPEPPAWSPELAQALAAEANLTPAGTPAGRGELARQALLALAVDPDHPDQPNPEHAEPIAALIPRPAARQLAMGPVGGTLLITCALLALKTHVEFGRNPDGTWYFKVKKTPTKDSLLTPLLKKLIAMITGGPPT